MDGIAWQRAQKVYNKNPRKSFLIQNAEPVGRETMKSPRRATRTHRLMFAFIAFLLAISALLVLSGCEKEGAPSASQIQQRPGSNIRVIPAAGELRVQTSAAEFVLSSNAGE